MPNKYVDFVSDEDFLEWVERVINAYPDKNQETPSPTKLLKNYEHGIDEFKAMFDMCVNRMDFENWIKAEKIRQDGKRVENKMGEFHQQLLGKVEGWEDLGTGDSSHVDLKNDEGTIYIEIKNKKNTINDGSGKNVRNNLEEIVKNNKDAIGYWAYIIQGGYKSEEDVWVREGYETNDRIRKISCDKVYELVTGDPHALEKTYDALPKAIGDILGITIEFSDTDQQLISEFKDYIFDD